MDSDFISRRSTSSSCAAMDRLRPVDRLTVTAIVENTCDSMSSAGCHNIDGFEYVSEKQKRRQSEKSPKDDENAFCFAGHGLSLLLRAESATAHGTTTTTHTLLLDAGPDPDLWKANARKLQLDPSSMEAVVLSHYHYDHSGGLRGAVPAIVENMMVADHDTTTTTNNKRENGRLLVDLHPSQVVSRGAAGTPVVPHHPDNPTAEELTTLGATVEMHGEEHTLCDDFFYVSGYIPRQSQYETGIPGHVTKVHGGAWVEDAEIADERYVACKVKDRGLVVFSSCSHAGITNVCRDARDKSKEQIFGVVGGLHLAGKQVENRIAQTVGDLKKDIHPAVVVAGHCTGWRAQAQLAVELDGHYQPLAVGGTYIFHSK